MRRNFIKPYMYASNRIPARKSANTNRNTNIIKQNLTKPNAQDLASLYCTLQREQGLVRHYISIDSQCEAVRDNNEDSIPLIPPDRHTCIRRVRVPELRAVRYPRVTLIRRIEDWIKLCIHIPVCLQAVIIEQMLSCNKLSAHSTRCHHS